MRFFSIFRRVLLEQTHNLTMLSLTIVFAPLCVFLYWLMFPGGSTQYSVLILNEDTGDLQPLIDTFKQVTYPDGKPLLMVEIVTDRAAAEETLKNRDAEVLLIIPPDFTAALQAAQNNQTITPASVTFVGDLTNPYYAVAGVMTQAALDQYIQAATGQIRPVQMVEQALGASAARTEFENYVPGLMIFAVIMLVFLAAMMVTRESETCTLRRLRTTRMTTWEFLGGTSAAVAAIGVAAVILTFATAVLLGFRSQGPIWVAVFIGAVTSLSIIGVGMLVACFSKTATQAFIIANFPLALFMFFSGAMFPLPRVPLFEFGGHPVGLYDILPPTHAVVALNKVLTHGAGLGDVTYEIGSLLILSIVYFAAGAWLFERTRMRSA